MQKTANNHTWQRLLNSQARFVAGMSWFLVILLFLVVATRFVGLRWEVSRAGERGGEEGGRAAREDGMQSAICLRTRYEKPGTEAAYGARSSRWRGQRERNWQSSQPPSPKSELRYQPTRVLRDVRY
eukprot:51569-Rhodomonas_salina.4